MLRDLQKQGERRLSLSDEPVQWAGSVAPKPDISTPEGLKQTLLKAQSIASIPASATGTQLSGIYEGLGITGEMKAKTKAQPTPGQIVEAVANGDAQLAVFLLNVLNDPRLDVVGPFPAEVQREVVYKTVGRQPKEFTKSQLKAMLAE